jgi:flagellar hook protein FlgE
MPTDSLFTGASGLDAYQNAIDVISNNIANVGTTGFKSQNITFQDLLYQTQAFATAPTTSKGGTDPIDEGIGVKTGAIGTNFGQGGLQTTGINTDLAVNGDGFFILRNVDGSGIPTYTRDGHFEINANGVLYDPASGLSVQGFLPNNGVIAPTSVPSTIHIPLGLTSQAVGTGFGGKLGPTGDQEFDVQFGGNLNQTLYLQANSGAAQASTISTTIYDSLGNSHLIDITFTPATAGGAGVFQGINPTLKQVNNTQGVATSVGTEWYYQISAGSPATDPAFAAGLAASPASTGYTFFDENGQFINTSSSGTAPAAGNVHVAGNQASAGAGDLLTISNWGTPGNNSAPTTAANPAAIGLSFADMSSLAGSTTATTVAQNGYGIGTLSNITIGQDGTITGVFTNGQQQSLAQVALASFQNENGLQRIGSSQFEQTANSGLAQVNAAGTGKLGTIVAGSLEESNVSLSDEFVKMIEAQSAFTANSKGIAVAQQDNQTVLNLIPGG